MKDFKKSIFCATFWCTFSGFYTGVFQLHKINLKFFFLWEITDKEVRQSPETHQLEA